MLISRHLLGTFGEPAVLKYSSIIEFMSEDGFTGLFNDAFESVAKWSRLDRPTRTVHTFIKRLLQRTRKISGKTGIRSKVFS